MSTVKDIDKLLQGFVNRGLPGCGLQITKDEKTIYEGYFGYSDIDTKEPVTKETIFRQASLSKLPLYTTLMMLYERGLFLLTDPIYKYFPEWKNSKKVVKNQDGSIEIVPTDRPVTIKDVLTMRCGLPYCNFPSDTKDPILRAMEICMQPLWHKGHYTLREQIAAISQAPLAFEPGEHWLYGFSSELAAGVIEAVCDKSIDDVFEELLFNPLEMNDTRSHFFGDIEERMVKLYQKTPSGDFGPGPSFFDEKHKNGPEHECGWARLFSSVNDYTKLVQMLANGGVYQNKRIMGRKTIDMMRSNVLNEVQLMDLNDDYNAGYGYGYGVRTLIDQAKGNHNGSLGAFGWTGGFGTWCEADPKERVSIVYMHNLIPNEEQYYHLRVRTAAYGLIE
ncbi:MAG TPA: serine hydrolase domain-containing protein [Lachnospiraceae bacterium]|nr:serine hydrolase domain-containing protein [Lachnospiraceae bacterium]